MSQSIKVSWNSQVRRVQLAPWTVLVTSLRTLFGLPASADLQLAYLDEDGDLIHLASDTELRDLTTVSRTLPRFALVVDGHVGPFPNQSRTSSLYDPPVIIPTTDSDPPPFTASTMSQPDLVTVEEVMDDPDNAPSYHTVGDKGKAPVVEEDASSFTPAAAAESSSSSPPPPPPPNANSIPAHLDQLFNTLQSVYAQHPEITQSFQALAEAVQASMADDLECAAKAIRKGMEQRDADTSQQAGPSFESGRGREGCGRGGGGCGRGSAHWHSHPHHPPPPFGMAFHGRGKWHHHRGGPPFHCRPNGNNGGGFNPNVLFSPAFQPPPPPPPSVPLSTEALKERLGQLHDMGFVDEAKNRDLLTRYEGNMERVVELLTREQHQPYDVEM